MSKRLVNRSRREAEMERARRLLLVHLDPLSGMASLLDEEGHDDDDRDS